MIRDLKRVKDKVAHLLKEWPELRDDDKKLWIAYLNTFHDIAQKMEESDFPFATFKQVLYDPNTPSMESIRRVRQKFQENGEYLGTKRAFKMKEETQVRQWAREN